MRRLKYIHSIKQSLIFRLKSSQVALRLYRWLIFSLSLGPFGKSLKHCGGRWKLSSFDLIYQNEFYGISRELKSFLGVSRFERLYIEHGFYLYSLPDQFLWPATTYITMTESRASIITKTTKGLCNVIAIGPYIAYVDAAPRKIPSDYAIFIPIHDLDNVDIEYDIRKVAQATLNYCALNGLRPVVLLYYKDYDTPDKKAYWMNMGFATVTCGSRYCFDHLKRLRGYLEHASSVITNGFGTHYVYAMFLDIPTVVLDVEVRKRFGEDFQMLAEIRANVNGKIAESNLLTLDAFSVLTIKELANKSSKARLEVSDEFGFGKVKSRADLRYVLGV